MLEYVRVRNFRSIHDQKVRFTGPITVLVGPNGSGKTNLVLATKFLSDALSENVARAIQMAGGLDQVFRLAKNRVKKCGIEIGVVIEKNDKLVRGFGFLDKASKPIHFVYKFEIGYDERQKRIKVNSESITWSNDQIKPRKIDLSQIAKERKRRGLETVSHDDLEIKQFRPRPGRPSVARDLDRYLVLLTHMLLSEVLAFNFSPEALRRESDLTEDSFPNFDGTGFSGFLMRMEKRASPKGSVRQRRFWGSTNNNAWNELVQFKSKINLLLKGFTASERVESPSVALRVKESHLKKELNLKQVSDGTLKSLAVAAVVLEGSAPLISFEEIENCLHPKAIASLIHLMRETAPRFGGQYLITTHSESLLNMCEPGELLIARRNRRGETIFKRPENLDTLPSELDAGGFGLGTYWGTHNGVKGESSNG